MLDDSSAVARDFWAFAVGLYARDRVREAALRLQDEAGADVNLLLFCIWLGRTGRGRLTDAELDDADEAVAAWRREAVEPLRSVRRRLKELADRTPGVPGLRTQVQQAELQAEAIAQRLILAAVPRLLAVPAATGPCPARSDGLEEAQANLDTAANLALYAARLRLRPEAAGAIADLLSHPAPLGSPPSP